MGDQLNLSHSWFKEKDADTTYLLAEMTEELTYCTHHIQKICAFFKAMQAFAKVLKEAGHQVRYLDLDDMQAYPATLPEFLLVFAKQINATAIEYQWPDEYRLRQSLKTLSKQTDIEIKSFSTEHFLLEEKVIRQRFSPNKSIRMENFYRYMRKRFAILMEPQAPDKPLGGQWNFDASNRKPLNKKMLDQIPQPLVFESDAKKELARIKKHKIPSIGAAENKHTWPVSRQDAVKLLQYFCKKQLIHFGTFQDAMTDQSEYGWSLYHSRLSFALNIKMLLPMEVINAAIKAYEASKGAIDLAQVEGFVRQILGWREYIRAMYWINMPDYKTKNALNAKRPLPAWYWTGDTKMHCLHQAINHSLTHAYSHHIQRLMLTGTFSLLAGINPDDVDEWYLGVYADAIEWVELPNTRGMALSADGGLIASKPYICSANYINKMSDYCQSCDYNPKIKVGDKACPYNSFYWAFLDRHKTRYRNNPRLAFAYKTLEAMDEKDRLALNKQASQYIGALDSL